MPDVVSLVVLFLVLAVALSLLVYHFKTGVPPVPASAAEAADVVRLLKQAGVPDEAVIYELGCGWGSLVKALARAFPQAQIRGIEWSPLPYWIARFRTRKLPNVQLQRGNFYAADLRDADAVTCYLMMKPMPKVAQLLDQSLRPGTPVVTLAFWFRGREVAAAVRKGAALYFWPAMGTEGLGAATE
jgi:hypothetical protein